MKLHEIIVYHGTGKVHPKLKPPIFVALDKEAARWFAIERGDDEQGVVLYGELNVKKPLDVRDREGRERMFKIMTDAGIEFTEDPYFEAPIISKYSPYEGSNPNDIIYVPAFVREMKKQGYDCLHCYDALSNEEPEVYVLLSPTQFRIQGHEIVSAT